MQLRKNYSLFFVLALVLNMFAANAVFASTDTEFELLGNETWNLTVPAQLMPGETGSITLEGNLDNGQQINVSADSTVTLESDLGDSQTLDIYFDGLSVVGTDGKYISETSAIEVADMSALFGMWTGAFRYEVSVTQAPVNKQIMLPPENIEPEEPVILPEEEPDDNVWDEVISTPETPPSEDMDAEEPSSPPEEEPNVTPSESVESEEPVVLPEESDDIQNVGIDFENADAAETPQTSNQIQDSGKSDEECTPSDIVGICI